jgi:hypothetical protein
MFDVKCVWISLQLNSKFLTAQEESREILSKIYAGLYVMCLSLLSDFKLEFCRHVLGKYPNIKCYQNSSSGSLVIPSRRTDEKRDVTKLVVAFCSFVHAPKRV